MQHLKLVRLNVEDAYVFSAKTIKRYLELSHVLLEQNAMERLIKILHAKLLHVH